MDLLSEKRKSPTPCLYLLISQLGALIGGMRRKGWQQGRGDVPNRCKLQDEGWELSLVSIALK